MSDKSKNDGGGIEGWYAVGQMGHRSLVGEVRQVQIGDAVLLRVDIPAHERTVHTHDDQYRAIQQVESYEARTEFISPASIYSLVPISQEAAMKLLAEGRMTIPTWVEPKTRMILPRHECKALPPGGEEEDEYDPEPF